MRLIISFLMTFPGLIFVSLSVFAAPYQVKDSRGIQTLPQVPVRVAAMNWDIAEQVLALGVTPVAMPNIAGYRAWVRQPAVPDSVQDIGRRVEPNLEKLAQLHPDVILVASPQVALISQLVKIAPVLYYQTYRADHSNAQAAIDNFLLIGEALGKTRVAKQRLASMDTEIHHLKQQLSAAYGKALPRVAVFRFNTPTSIYLYGQNSIPQDALARLGLQPALPQPATQWGVMQKRLHILSQLSERDVALYIQPFDQEARLKTSVIWQALPVVKANHVHAVSPVWSYGGAMSILYHARALTQSLLALAPAQQNRGTQDE